MHEDVVQDTPQVLFLMSGGQLVVASIGVFQPAQLHSSVIQTPSPAPPVPFSTAPQVLASFPHPEHNPASAAVLNPGEKNSEWEEEDDLEDASDPDYLPEGGEEISDDDDDDDDVNEGVHHDCLPCYMPLVPIMLSSHDVSPCGPARLLCSLLAGYISNSCCCRYVIVFLMQKKVQEATPQRSSLVSRLLSFHQSCPQTLVCTKMQMQLS